MEENFEEARAPLEESLTMARDMGLGKVECVILFNLGVVCQHRHGVFDAFAQPEPTL